MQCLKLFKIYLFLVKQRDLTIDLKYSKLKTTKNILKFIKVVLYFVKLIERGFYMFLIKQVSNDLGITPQAIYKQKEDLQKKGYMLKNSTNDWEITSDGYNYLKEKQINRFKRNNISLKEVNVKNIDFQEKEENNSLNETLINFYETRLEEIKQSYENQLNEQKKQVEYFKNLYEEEKSERIKTNAQYQTYLLGTAEDNKRHWWQFWNKNISKD